MDFLPTFQNGDTPLHIAVALNFKGMVELLLVNKASAFIRNKVSLGPHLHNINMMSPLNVTQTWITLMLFQQSQTPFDIAFVKKFDHLVKLLSHHSEGTLPAPPLTQPTDVEVDDGYDENMTSSSVASDAIAPSPRFFVFNLLYTT